MFKSRIKILIIITVFLIFCNTVYSQDNITINHADSLIGKNVNGEMVREAIGNVELTHNNVKIYCNRVNHFTAQNKANLYGNVKVYKDTLSIFAPSADYYGNEGKVICTEGATLNDTKVTLKADYGIYFFTQDLANFKGNVKIYDGKSYTITSDELDYYRPVNKSVSRGNVKIVNDSAVIWSDNLVYEKNIGLSVATGNVKIESDSTIIKSDKLTYKELDKTSVAEKNVIIFFTNKNTTIFGNYGENYERRNYSLVKGNAKLVRIELKNNKEDTTFIYGNIMESYRDVPEHYIATDSVHVIKNDFLSNSGMGYYYKYQNKKGGTLSLSKAPVVWKEDLQITGDSIYSIFEENLEKVVVLKSAFALKPNKNYQERFDQISGVFMTLFFKSDELENIRVDTNAASIYFTYNNETADGANKSNGDIISIVIKDQKVSKVSILGKSEGTYYPERKVDVPSLRLLGFKLRFDKPVRK